MNGKTEIKFSTWLRASWEIYSASMRCCLYTQRIYILRFSFLILPCFSTSILYSTQFSKEDERILESFFFVSNWFSFIRSWVEHKVLLMGYILVWSGLTRITFSSTNMPPMPMPSLASRNRWGSCYDDLMKISVDFFSIENRTKQQFGNSFRERGRKRKKKEKYLNFCCSTCFIGSTLNHPAEERASAGNVQRTANLTSYKSIKPPEIHHIHILYAWQHKICLITEFQTRERAEEAIKAQQEKPQEIISFHRAAPLHVDVFTELQRWRWATNNVKCGFLDEIG